MPKANPRHPKFPIPGGPELRAKGWRQEALLRLLENVLSVGEDPDNLIVYAALGKAARNWAAHKGIVKALTEMDEDQTLLIQSGKPIGLVKTHAKAPLVIMANCNIVGQWAKAEVFYELQRKGLICWGGLTAGDWQYIGSQGVIQGTYEIFSRIAERHFDNDLRGRFILTAGLGGMGGAQPLAGRMAHAATLVVEIDQTRIDKRLQIGFLERQARDLDEALALIRDAQARREPISVGLLGNAADVYPEMVKRGIRPDAVTDQTSAHDPRNGYLPLGWSLDQWERARANDARRTAWDFAATHVMSSAFAGFMADLNAAVERRIWLDGAKDTSVFDEPAQELAAHVLSHRLKAAKKGAKRLSDASDEQIHHLRIALKKLRYTIELLACLFDEDAVHGYIAPLKALQDDLGHLNDVRTAHAILTRLETDAAGDSALGRAGGLILGWHERGLAEQEGRLSRHVRRFRKREPFW